MRSCSPIGRSAGPRTTRPGCPLTFTGRLSTVPAAACATAAMNRAMAAAPASGSGAAIALPPPSA